MRKCHSSFEMALLPCAFCLGGCAIPDAFAECITLEASLFCRMCATRKHEPDTCEPFWLFLQASGKVLALPGFQVLCPCHISLAAEQVTIQGGDGERALWSSGVRSWTVLPASFLTW